MTELNRILKQPSSTNEESWISTSDMMTGLMMIFLFISIIYIAKVKSIVGEVQDTQDVICQELRDEFEQEERKWRMKICENGLVVNFENEGYFLADQKTLTPAFEDLLTEFYPRFKFILWKYVDEVSELRIEGHASSEANVEGGLLERYLYNANLSQGRSYEVMNYVLKIPEINTNREYLNWSYNNLTAHGMSSSVPVKTEGGIENKKASRRVEFRIKTKAQDGLLEIIKALDGT
tara:strand:- start:2840 stop:3544 length:705 start_codon:yes stop_codon:yes gene_type:complete